VASLTDDGWVGIVDDDASMRSCLARVFDANHIPCATFSSAEEFLQRRETARPACMVLDVHLGGMTGFDLHDRLAASGPPLCPVVFVTAHDEIPIAQFHRAEGCTLLRKPFDIEALLALVRPHLRAAISGNGTVA